MADPSKTIHKLTAENAALKKIVEELKAADTDRRERADWENRCVLCNLTIPGMNGRVMLTTLRKPQPDIPVILASGYDKAHVMSGEHSELPHPFLGKPYSSKTLSDGISQALVNRA